MLQHFNQIIRLAPESLSPQERLLLIVLEDARGDYGIFPTQEVLVARTGMSERAVRRWAAVLCEKGYLTTRQEPILDATGLHGSTTHYFIDYKALGDDTPAATPQDPTPAPGAYDVTDFLNHDQPKPEEPKPVKAKPPAPKKTARVATRIPDGWAPDPELVAWTRANAPAAANNTEVERFRDYWTAKAGADGRKLDWRATWRNWARKAQEQAARPAYRNQSQIMADTQRQAAAFDALQAHARATGQPEPSAWGGLFKNEPAQIEGAPE